MPTKLEAIIKKYAYDYRGIAMGRNDLLEKFLFLFGNEYAEQAVEEYEYILKQKIGLLRQWINEDRIDNLEKIVSSEQIEKWLIN